MIIDELQLTKSELNEINKEEEDSLLINHNIQPKNKKVN